MWMMLVVFLVLRSEVEKLKQLNVASVGDDVISQSQREVAWLRQQLMMKEAEMNEMKRSVTHSLHSVVSSHSLLSLLEIIFITSIWT